MHNPDNVQVVTTAESTVSMIVQVVQFGTEFSFHLNCREKLTTQQTSGSDVCYFLVRTYGACELLYFYRPLETNRTNVMLPRYSRVGKTAAHACFHVSRRTGG